MVAKDVVLTLLIGVWLTRYAGKAAANWRPGSTGSGAERSQTAVFLLLIGLERFDRGGRKHNPARDLPSIIASCYLHVFTSSCGVFTASCLSVCEKRHPNRLTFNDALRSAAPKRVGPGWLTLFGRGATAGLCLTTGSPAYFLDARDGLLPPCLQRCIEIQYAPSQRS